MTDAEKALVEAPTMFERLGIKALGGVESLLAEGWAYKDIPWMDEPCWEIILDGIGRDNLRVLAATVRADLMRGQFMISPEGRQNAADKKEEMVAAIAAVRKETPDAG